MSDAARNGPAAFTAVIHAHVATVDARGELEIFTVDLLRGALANLALHNPAHITVNLSEVTTIDRYSARLLLTWHSTGAPDSRIAVNLRNPKPGVAAILAAEPAPVALPSPAQVDTPTASPNWRPQQSTAARQPRSSTTASAPHRPIRRLAPGTPRYPTSAAP